eukprot:3206579-Heterocapsa_arctica.AAC.1
MASRGSKNHTGPTPVEAGPTPADDAMMDAPSPKPPAAAVANQLPKHLRDDVPDSIKRAKLIAAEAKYRVRGDEGTQVAIRVAVDPQLPSDPLPARRHLLDDVPYVMVKSRTAYNAYSACPRL